MSRLFPNCIIENKMFRYCCLSSGHHADWGHVIQRTVKVESDINYIGVEAKVFW